MQSALIFLTSHGELAEYVVYNVISPLGFISKFDNYKEKLKSLINVAMKQMGFRNLLKFETSKMAYQIPLRDILYITHDSVERKSIVITDYSEFHIGKTLSEIFEQLSPQFKYSHRACIVNMERVTKLDTKKKLITFDNGKTIDQWVTIPGNKSYVIYDAWENRLKKAEIKQKNGETKVHVSLVPLEMMILVEGTLPEETEEKESGSREQQLLTDFQVFRCEAEAYPAFEGKEKADLLHGMAELHPEFSGFYRYETKVQAENWKEAVLTIEDVYESAEVFVNGISAGMKTARPYRYELGNLSGEISIVIEVATTVERKARAIGADVNGMGLPGPLSPTGIVGTVEISFQK